MMDEKHADTKPGALAQEHLEALALLLADSDRAESHRDYVALTGPEKAALRAALATIKAQEEGLVQLRQVAHGALGTMPSAEIIALARAWRAKYGSNP